ncbi:GrpB protein-domain-containing protein [Pestalotiopsis sp. NC0098]|nr:GrpB protein-domain-containing protein [Pestalotiopsis sp. NC0098]
MQAMDTDIDIMAGMDFDPDGAQIVSKRPMKSIEVVNPTPRWAASFVSIAQRIQTALGDIVLEIEHVGSTSIPIAAKDVIDIDLIVTDPSDEGAYVQALENAGFQFLLREPDWHEHRLFGLAEPYANVHIFGPKSAEHARHILFKRWLIEHEDDRVLYENAKRAAAEAGRNAGDNVTKYNKRKEPVVREILDRAFQAQGLPARSPVTT